MRIALVLARAPLLAGCGSQGSAGKVVVLGFDGMDPPTLDMLMAEGKMPNFAHVRQDGAYGRLISSPPLLSPIIWTTIATGKTAVEHGIGHFVAVNEKTGEELPVTSQMRKVKAIWNIASEAKRKVGVVGYWATWPAETVNGSIVSDHTCERTLDGSPPRTPAEHEHLAALLEARGEPIAARGHRLRALEARTAPIPAS